MPESAPLPPYGGRSTPTCTCRVHVTTCVCTCTCNMHMHMTCACDMCMCMCMCTCACTCRMCCTPCRGCSHALATPKVYLRAGAPAGERRRTGCAEPRAAAARARRRAAHYQRCAATGCIGGAGGAGVQGCRKWRRLWSGAGEKGVLTRGSSHPLHLLVPSVTLASLFLPSFCSTSFYELIGVAVESAAMATQLLRDAPPRHHVA